MLFRSVFAIPPTNPFINDTNYLPEIWNYGMRNPWRFSFDRTTGDLWIADVGQNAYEEINLEPYGSGGGFNYGWKCYEGLHVYNTTGNCASFTPDMIPVFEYTHSGKCSVSGGFIYRGAKWNRLFGRYVYADYCENKIRCLTKNSNGLWVDSILLNMPSAGFSCFGEDQFGELYAGNNTTGIVYSITDTASCTPVAAFAFTDSITVCNQNSYTFTTPYQPGFLYQWYLDGSPISNSDTNSIISTQTGTYYVQVVGVNFCTNTSDSVYIEFNPVPAATINALDSIYCDNDVADTLTASPAGGYFTIDGDTAFVFDPVSAGLGQHTVQYFYTDTNGCSTVVTQQVLVDACLGINE